MVAVAEHIKVPKLRFPEFSGEWMTKKLEDIAKRRTAKNDLASSELICIEMESIEKETGRLLEIFSVPSTTRSIFAEGDVLYGKLRPYLKKYYKARFDGVCSTEFWVFRGDTSSILIEFLIQTEDFQRVANISEGSKMPRADWSLVRKHITPIPALPEQQKIAEFLTAVDEKIGKLKRKKELLEAYKKGAMQKLFSQEIRFKDDQGNPYPDWEEKRLGEVYRVTRGKVLATSEVYEHKSKTQPYPVYSSQTKADGLLGYYSQFLFSDAITWTTDGANAGNVSFRTGKFYCTNVCGVLLSNQGYSNSCMAQHINRITHRYVSYVGNPKLMNNVMSEIKTTFPSLPEQQKIAEFLTGIDDKIKAVANQIDKAAEFKKGLLQKMFV